MITSCLQTLLDKKRDEVLAWLSAEQKKVPVPIYASYEIRDNGVKASVIDSNLFPAGFNNLAPQAKKHAAAAFRDYLSQVTEEEDMLIVPEAHTRNLFYLSNLHALQSMLFEAGYRATIGTIREDVEEVLTVRDHEGHELVLERMENRDGCLQTRSFRRGIIVLNNDFSVEEPPLLRGVRNPIMPPIGLGWLHRRKYNHFRHFCALTKELGKAMGFDQWLICPITHQVDDIDFKSGKGIDKVAEEVENVLSLMRKKYEEYGIKDTPQVFVKDNSGTYGMGIVTARSGEDILSLNSDARRKMSRGKQRSPITSVVVQEGIATKHKSNGGTAEPVLYAVGGSVVGGFMRVHDEKDELANLNAPGAKFDVLLADDLTRPIINYVKDEEHLSLYRILARLACIAIGKEMEEAR